MSLPRIRTMLVVLTVGFIGCTSPTAPTPTPSAAPASAPMAVPTGPQPTISSVSPNIASTAGSWGTITGTNFEPGATVQFGNRAFTAWTESSTILRFASSGAHAAGSVDITVMNPGGLSATLAGGYTYEPPNSFDANGEWVGHTDARNDYLTDMHFTIRNNVLVSLSCGTPVAMPTVVSVENGSFSFAGADGLEMSGVLASAATSYGQVTAPGCGDGRWWADKAPTS